jgi:Rrf2 family protein
VKFSAQEEFGLRCLVAIAVSGEDGSMTIPAIASREGITEPHAGKLLAILRRGGFITSTRGQHGGYRLTKPSQEIVVGDVLVALGGRLYESEFCDRHAGIHDECAHVADCSLRGLWTRIQSAVDRVVFNITLAELISGSIEPDVVNLTSPASYARGRE